MLDAVLLAARPLLAAAFTLWGSPVTWLEIVAFVLSVWMVLCNLRVSVLGWPLAMLSSLLYALLFAASRLYGEAGLQIVFVLVSGWGWWQWLRGRNRSASVRADGGSGSAAGPLRIRWLSPQQRWLALAATLAAWPLLGALLGRMTDSDVPYLDALPTVGSVCGQLLLGRKCVDNWPVWVAVNAFSIGLFAFKGLWLTVLLYAVFLLLALAGWRAWARLAQPPLLRADGAGG